jgi:ADP-ribose pyrophosphatase YjhB (NUDIX family)
VKITRSLSTTPGQGATHVLHWLPGYLDAVGGGCWNLQEAAEYETAVPARGPRNTGVPRDEDPAVLAAWAGGQLGYPVTTELAYATLASVTLRPPSLNGGKEPVYYLRPAPLTNACEAFFTRYPAAVTDLDEDGLARLILIAVPGGPVHQLVRFAADWGTSYEIVRRGTRDGADISPDGSIWTRGSLPEDEVTALVAAALPPYPDGSYTAPEVLAEDGRPGGWAEESADPHGIDWEARIAAALIPYELDPDGLPLNPFTATGIRDGRGELGRYGENAAADAIVTATRAGVRHLLMVRRKDCGEWAVPGGMIEPGETPGEAALRELAEETGLAADPSRARPQEPRYVPDRRASDRAWIVTGPVLIDLAEVDEDGEVGELPAVDGGDDAAEAAWVPARNIDHAAAALAVDHDGGVIYSAHTEMLAEFLGTPTRL